MFEMGAIHGKSLHNVIQHTKHTLFINKKIPG